MSAEGAVVGVGSPFAQGEEKDAGQPYGAAEAGLPNNGEMEQPSADLLDYLDMEADLRMYDQLPPFASASNIKLDSLVREKERMVEQLNEELVEHTERVKIMEEHLGNVRRELEHTESLCTLKTKEIETEQHMQLLADRESSRVQKDMKRLKSQVEDSQDALARIKNDIFAAAEKRDQFQREMNWNQQELLQWSLAAKQKDEDQEAVRKYQQMDNVKIRNLTLKLEKLHLQVQEKKELLQSSLTDTQAVQIELDKTAEEYRRIHLERQELIRQWDEAKRDIQRRDEDIARAGEQLVQLRATLRKLDAEIKDAETAVQREQDNNTKAEVQLSNAERLAEKRRQELHRAGEGLGTFQDETFAMRNELGKTTTELNQSLRTAEHLRVVKAEREVEIQKLQSDLDEAKESLKREYRKTDDLNEQSKQVELLHKRHEQELESIEKEVRKMKEQMFKQSHDLFALRRTEATLIAEISSAQATSRNLQGRVHYLDQRSLKQQEMLYNIEFQVQQLERKVAHAGGKRSLEETIELNKRINELKDQLEAHRQQHTMLTNQVRRLQDELRATKRRHAELQQNINDLTEAIGQVDLKNETAQNELRAATKQKEELVVQHDMLKLEVKKLRDTLTSVSGEVLGLENQKLQLELSIAEKEHAIASDQDISRAEIKVAEEGRHFLARDVQDRKLKVEKLKQKFEVIAGKMGASFDEEQDKERSQAYYIIAAAQTREELQRKGDTLNETIKKAEKEIRLLSKTLQHLTGRNQVYRESFHKADMDGPDAQLKEQLEEQARAASDDLFRKRSYLREVTVDFEERRAALAQLRNNSAGLGEELAQLAQEHDKLQAESKQLDASLQRAKRSLREAQQVYRAKARTPAAAASASAVSSVEESHIELQDRRARSQAMVNYLAEFAAQHPELHAAMADGLSRLGIELRPSTANSASTTSSARSSVASVKSVTKKTALKTKSTALVFDGAAEQEEKKRPGTSSSSGSIKSASRAAPAPVRSPTGRLSKTSSAKSTSRLSVTGKAK